MKKHLSSFTISLVLLFGTGMDAFADCDPICNPIGADTILGIIQVLENLAVQIAFALSALAIMWAAWLYMTSGGSEEKVSQGHKALTYGVIGLFVVLSVRFIQDIVVGIASGAATSASLVTFVESITRGFGGVLMGVSVLMILYSSFLFLTGGGSEGTVKQARDVLTYAIVGIVVAVLAFAIPSLIQSLAPAGGSNVRGFNGVRDESPQNLGSPDTNPIEQTGPEQTPANSNTSGGFRSEPLNPKNSARF